MSKGSVLYVPHGGGPLPLLGDPGHTELTQFFGDIGKQLEKPEAIIVISAHWEEQTPVIQSGATPDLFYDYYGFPEESYQITYPAPGAPGLADSIFKELQSRGFNPAKDQNRGFDHGVFVPLKLIFPEATIPCLQVSLIKGLDPRKHLELGQALSVFREQNVMILGSGMSFHNMSAFFQRNPSANTADHDFDVWLQRVCCSDELLPAERDHELINWAQAPSARYCHPREEHLIPLHVCVGAAGEDAQPAKQVFNGDVLGKRVSAFLWED